MKTNDMWMNQDVKIKEGEYKDCRGYIIDKNNSFYFVNIFDGSNIPCVLYRLETAELYLEFITKKPVK